MKYWIFFIIFLLACAKGPCSHLDYSACESDNDCVLIRGCCGCGGGSSVNAANVRYNECWEANRNCAGIECPAVESEHVSCYSDPLCVDGKCTMVPDKEKICDFYFKERCENNTIWEESIPDEMSCFVADELCSGTIP